MLTESELNTIDKGKLKDLINLYNKTFLLSNEKHCLIERVLINNRTDFIFWLLEDDKRCTFFRKFYFPELIHLSLRTGNSEIIEKHFPR